MSEKDEIELLKAKVRALELEIELIKAKTTFIPNQFIPFPIYPYNPYPLQSPFYYGLPIEPDYYKVTC